MGESSSQQSTQSSTSPWSASQPEVDQLLSSLSPQIANSGITGAQTGAINQLTQLGQAGNPYGTGTTSAINSMLAGGGANNQAGTVNNAYQQYQAQTNPLASNTNYDPMSTPGIGTQLAALNNSITNQVNGQFASAGRSGSAANSYALGSGLAAGEAPVLTAQYNANVANQQNAAGNLYGAGNTTANTLAGFQQNAVANQNSGIGNTTTALNNSTWGPSTVLSAQNQLSSIPASNLGLLAQIGIPLAQLGTNSSGTSTGTATESGAQEFQQILSGIGSLIPKGGLNFNFGS